MTRRTFYFYLLFHFSTFQLLPLFTPAAHAYSVLAHEAMIDAAWDDVIAPIVRQRFPRATAEQIRHARAYAYGGSVVQDLGYYPFGSHLFTNLVHYVRSGDFVEALFREAHDPDELAFAFGALAHYLSDTIGHPVAVNRSVPLLYPKLRTKFGAEVTYDEDPKRHVMVEFAFDVVQLAAGAYLPESYRAFVGFDVAKGSLERAFRDTYALDLDDLFLNEDLAIGTYRYAVSQAIPELTRAAWKAKRDEIQKLTPGVARNAFVFEFTRRQYEDTFGTMYKKPGWLARTLVFVMKLLPKVGPFAPLAFRSPTPEAERLFADSFRSARDRYRARAAEARGGTIQLSNLDFDTGQPAVWGEYRLADETYAAWLDKLATRGFKDVTPTQRRDLVRFFNALPATESAATARTGKQQRELIATVRRQIQALRTAAD